MGAAATFDAVKPRLFGLAYRMLGSRAEAEDVVQDAYIRWHQADEATVRNAEAWLVTTATRLAIDRLRSLSFDLAVQGAGSASVGLATVDQLKVSIAGTGSVQVAGAAPKLTALVRGISTLEASGLTVSDATIGAQGPATVRVTVTGTAKVDAQGAAVVDFAGRPACTVKAVGSATVSGCR